MADPTCPVCGYPEALSRCWRLTCPTNGARESFAAVQSAYDAAKSASAAAGQRVKFGHPATWPDPPEAEFQF